MFQILTQHQQAVVKMQWLLIWFLLNTLWQYLHEVLAYQPDSCQSTLFVLVFYYFVVKKKNYFKKTYP